MNPYPAPWRPVPDGPCAQTLLHEQNREEELFQRIMGQARHEHTPLEELFEAALRLAFPHAQDDDHERALGVIKSRIADWKKDFDLEGNPCWITLKLPERAAKKDAVQPGAVHPPECEKRGPQKTDTAPPPRSRSVRGLVRLLVFGCLCGLFYYGLVVRGCTMP